jgi:predicted Fe-Mo cluster-binding NifX family protein
MKRLRIALGSDDGVNIILNHMGESKYFLIYDLFEDGQFELVEKRENLSGESEKHADENKMKKAMSIFEDSDVIMARKLSPNYIKMRDNTKFQPLLSKIDSIEGSMAEMGASFAEIYGLVERRRCGERMKTIPTIGEKT